MLTRPLTKGLTRSLTRGLVPVVGPTYDPDALDYFNRKEILGDVLSDTEKSWWNSFIIAIKADSTWDQIDELWVPCGGTWASITAKLKYASSPDATLTNFVSADYAPTGTKPGLKGDGSTKTANLNWSPVDTITAPNAHHGRFSTEAATAALDCQIGSVTGGAGQMTFYLPLSNGYIYSDMFSLVTGRAVSPSPNTGQGMVIASSDSTSHRLIVNGSTLVTESVPIGLVSVNEYFTHSVNLDVGFSDARMSLAVVGRNLSIGQETTLNNATQVLMAAFGYTP